MKTVKLGYNPYKMHTELSVDGVDVCKVSAYRRVGEFVKRGIPLQTWIEPIPHMDWAGFVNELFDPERNDEAEILFSGRRIDLEDLKRAVEAQNCRRRPEARVKVSYYHEKLLDDQVLAQNVEEIVRQLKSERFQALVEQRSSETLKKSYAQLEQNYALAKESEFYIVFSGVYTCGKSTILNLILRHNVLPTAAGTCTKVNCRIRHDRSLGSKVSLAGFDGEEKERKEVLKRRVFERDEECAALFWSISTEERYAEVKLVEIGADLSHLYPESVSDESFTIVLIDTPGVDSAASEENGKNLHAQIALESISMESKPMIVLCANAKKAEEESVGAFMREILMRNRDGCGGFNDRFLFLMNQCDSVVYEGKETARELKETFFRYLTDSKKWNITEDETQLRELARRAEHFVPRVFLTSALAEWGLRDGVHQRSKKELVNDGFRRQVRAVVDHFAEEVAEYENENFFLSRHCDLSAFRKEELERQFAEALENGDPYGAAKLQTGILPVELAIRDYVERYAYPIKVRALLNTFEAILRDVKSHNAAVLAELERAEKALKGGQGELGGAESELEHLQGLIKVLTKAEGTAQKQIAQLDGIQFDGDTLERAKTSFRRDIEEDATIAQLRRSPVVDTGSKSRDTVEREIQGKVLHIEGVFSKALRKTEGTLRTMKEAYDRQLEGIFKLLQAVVRSVEETGVFRRGKFDFRNSAAWNLSFPDIDSEDFAQKMRESIVDKSYREERILNPGREDWLNSANPLKWLGAAFRPKYVSVTRTVSGQYDASSIVTDINNYLKNLEVNSARMEESFQDNLAKSKKAVRELTATLLRELRQFQEEVESVMKRIRALIHNMDALKKEIEAYRKTVIWLESLIRKMEGHNVSCV